MIPKRIIYCWFGGKEKTEDVKKCISSWKEKMPNWEYMEINESNFDISYNDYVKDAYENKKWAFVSDVARLWALYNYGGVYMDTDVMCYKPLDAFLNHNLFTGFEQPNYPVTAVMGATKGNKIIKEMLDMYDGRDLSKYTNMDGNITNTVMMSEVISKYIDRTKMEFQENKGVAVYPKETFCRAEGTPSEKNNKDVYTRHLMLGSWLKPEIQKTNNRKKIIFYQSYFSPIGGVETMAYNWCFWMRNFFDILVIYSGGDQTRLRKMAKLVNIEQYNQNKIYECDIFIRNSVWGVVPRNVKAKRSIEMRHADYKFLQELGTLKRQYTDMGIKEIVACGEYVKEKSIEVMHDNPTVIKNILLPRQKTNKIIKLISCTRLDPHKGWNRMLKMMEMMKKAGIKFEWLIFTNSSSYRCDYEEVHFYKQRYDIWDYLADADYTVLLSDSEGLPYTVQESLQYQVPCIVTDVGGCKELIKDGVNGYVVPLDMNFDINKIKNIPKCPEYDNHSLEDWLKYLEYDGEVTKKQIDEIASSIEEEKTTRIVVKCIKPKGYFDIDLQRHVNFGEQIDVPEDRADFLRSKNAVEIVGYINKK